MTAPNLAASTAGAEPPAIDVRQLTAGFHRHPVLRDVALTVQPGERVALLGPNGAGKTTLLRTLATLQQPLRGTVQVFDTDIVRHRREARRMIGYLGHTPHVIGHLTTRENLDFLASIYGIASPEARTSEVLEIVGLSRVERRTARELSRGQLQRLALAAATLHTPRVLLLDEPNAALDRDGARLLSGMLGSLCPGAAIIVSTHDHCVATEICERRATVDAGRLTQEAPRDQAARPSQPQPPSAVHLPFFNSSWAILRKDALVEWRAREQGPPLLAFTLLMAILFDIAFVSPAATDTPSVAAGVAWATLLLAASLSGVRLFGSERDQDTMTRLRLAPIDQSAVFLAKYALLALHVLIVGIVQLAVLSVLLDLQLLQWGVLATLGLVTMSLSAITAMQSALVLNSRAREVLMPLLAVPLAIPVMLAGIGATLETLQGSWVPGAAPWLGLLAVTAAVFLSLALLLYPQAIET